MERLCNVLILLSTYNGAFYLKEQIDSLLNQQLVNVHILIRDDGSIDSSVAIIEQYISANNNVTLIKGSNIGCAQSFGCLLKEAHCYVGKYDYFAFSDQDDVWLPYKLKTAVDVLQNMDGIESMPIAYCSNVNVVDKDLSYMGKMMNNDSKVIFSKDNSLLESHFMGCSAVFNAKVIEMYHKYTPLYMSLHDLWIYQMCIFFGKVYYDNRSYILYRQFNNLVGANITFKSKVKSKIKSIKTIVKQHYRELEAKELLRCYHSILSPDDEKLICIVANYRKSLRHKMNLLFPPAAFKYLRMTKLSEQFWLILRIVIAAV